MQFMRTVCRWILALACDCPVIKGDESGSDRYPFPRNDLIRVSLEPLPASKTWKRDLDGVLIAYQCHLVISGGV